MLICRDGYEIAVVYFRCGYDPDNYELDTVGIIIKKKQLGVMHRLRLKHHNKPKILKGLKSWALKYM